MWTPTPRHIEWLYRVLLTYGREIDRDHYINFGGGPSYFKDSLNLGLMARYPDIYAKNTMQIYTITDKGIEVIKDYYETHS